MTLAFTASSIEVVSGSNPYVFNSNYEYYIHIQLKNDI